jgi:hypothetical protein
MLSSITPLGERGRGNRWALTASAYVAASAAGGAVLGAVLALLGVLFRIAGHPSAMLLWSAVAAVCLLAATAELRPRMRFPTTRRQVNEEWLGRYRGWVYGLGFGFQLGMGVVTIVTSVTVFAMAGLALVAGLSGSFVGGVVIGTAFGLMRASPITAFASVSDHASLQARHRRLQAWEPRSRTVAAALVGAVAVAAIVAAAM